MDGNEYIDYVMGHGALILGYQPKKVLEAFQELASYNDRDPDLEGLQEFYVDWRDYDEYLVLQRQSDNLRMLGEIELASTIESRRWIDGLVILKIDSTHSFILRFQKKNHLNTSSRYS